MRSAYADQRNGKTANCSQDGNGDGRLISQRHVRSSVARRPERQQDKAQESHGQKKRDHARGEANPGAQKELLHKIPISSDKSTVR